MVYAGSISLAVALVAISSVARANHLKAVVVDTEPVAKETSVSASFGGYSAKAGLGGSGSGGGLFASADSPHGSAGAGLGGSSSGGGLFASANSPHGSAGAGLGGSGAGGGLGATAHTGGAGPAVSTGTGHKPGSKPGTQPGLFDGIFNIPISVLQAVNTYLNNRGPVTKPVHRRRGHHPEVVHKTVIPEQHGAVGPTDKADGAVDSSIANSHAESAAARTGEAPAGQGHIAVQKRVNYDDIFNIPISALKSVNQLLNG